jgi:hypothetical protein
MESKEWQLMRFKHSFKQIAKIAEETGSEITFSERLGLEWYWHNLEFTPEEKDVPRLIEAIKTLREIGFTQN